MKGIAFNIVAEILIALVAAFVILSIFQGFFAGWGGTALCKIYQVILTLPIPSSLKPTIAECSLQPTEQRIVITDTGVQKVTEDLANRIYDCWTKESDSGRSGITFTCYEIHFNQVDGTIKESDVTGYLKANNYCGILPNNYLDQEKQSIDCGNQNKIYWLIGNISGTDVDVFVKYNAFQHLIDVE